LKEHSLSCYCANVAFISQNHDEPLPRMSNVVDTIVKVFTERGSGQYGAENVTQLQHALQTAQLAEEASAPPSLIVAALVHGIGHIFENSFSDSHDLDANLDDGHEHRANTWLKRHFGSKVADPVRLHVLAKRYLCTMGGDYVKALSPTSHKSFLDQGGRMSSAEVKAFEREPELRPALELRRWDDQSKNPDRVTPGLEHFRPFIEEALGLES
jgi:phosphonate degradation associated HDIG domain protein